MAYSPELREAAKRLYLRRYTPQEIADELTLPNNRIIYHWADKYGWRDLLREEEVDDAIARRVVLLMDLPEKSPAQLKELDMLIEKHVKLKKQRQQAGRNSSANGNDHGNPTAPQGKGNRPERSSEKKQKGKKRKNDVSHLTADDFQEWVDSLFEYQKKMRDVKNDPNMPRIRNVLKSRQIGFTYGCAGEAFEDAVLNGRDQIFISASRVQAEVFKKYIVNTARQFFDIELTGNPIMLNTAHGVKGLYFLSTNASTAQSQSGNVYIDEYFWIRDFHKVSEVVEGCATHDHFHITYFSTPSAKNHPAYPFWAGEKWKGNKASRRNIDFPTEKELRNGGRVCPDQQWRYVINVYDAVKGGCHFIKPDKIKEEKSPDAFANLYMCQFVDDSSSVFKFTSIEKLMVEESKWKDYDLSADRPFGNREVWLGYDPSRTRDNACLVIVAPPIGPKEKFRVLRKIYWNGLNFQHHVGEIRKIFQQFNVSYLGMDVTGIGAGVHDLLQAEFPREVVPIHYSNENKNRLVLKMIDVVESKRLEFSREEKDIAAAFMAIKRAATSSGNMMTFKAERSTLAGHADAFWAISHALDNEPLNTAETQRGSSYTFGKQP